MSCLGDCTKRKEIIKRIRHLCPNFDKAIGKSIFFASKSVSHLEVARSNKNRIPNSPPDTANKCKMLAEEYDRVIALLIDNNEPLGIEVLLEIPFLITSELCESGQAIDDETRRLVFFASNCIHLTDFVDVWTLLLKFTPIFGQNIQIIKPTKPFIWYTKDWKKWNQLIGSNLTKFVSNWMNVHEIFPVTSFGVKEMVVTQSLYFIFIHW